MKACLYNFNPRSPRGERRRPGCRLSRMDYFNPRSPRGERPGRTAGAGSQAISIHAPRVGSDDDALAVIIHPVFQSTLPAWGATFVLSLRRRCSHRFQSTLPAWGATQASSKYSFSSSFQSTLPAWGATVFVYGKRANKKISIHAPRVGSDSVFVTYGSPSVNFNPRSPRGERRRSRRRNVVRRHISIHAPRVGSDGRCCPPCRRTPYFNPRSPRGERRTSLRCSAARTYFNPRSPRGERPVRILAVEPVNEFQSTLPAWGATRDLGF